MTVALKRFLRGAQGDFVNADYIVRLYFDASGKLFADMPTGPAIELHTDHPVTDPLERRQIEALPVRFASAG